MVRRSVRVSEEIVTINEVAFFYPSDFVNTKTTIPLTLCISVYIHHYSPPLWGIVIY